MNLAQDDHHPSQDANVGSKLRHAKALEERALLQDAEHIYSKLAAEHPENLRLRVRLLRFILKRRRADPSIGSRRKELLEHLQHPIFNGPGEAGPTHRLGILNEMGEISLAQMALLPCLKAVTTLDGCEKCFTAIPALIEGGDQSAYLIALLQRVRQLSAQLTTNQAASATLELSLLLALGRFAEFNARYDVLSEAIPAGDNGVVLAAVRRRLGLPRREVFQEQKVFGIGLAKTATSSLSRALTILGIDNGHWTNPLSRQLLSDIDFFMLGGATDGSVSHNFEKLYYQYPNAKFILTERAIEDWSQSMKYHYTDPGTNLHISGWPSPWRDGFRSESVQFGLYLQFDRYQTAYSAHEHRVHNFFADKPRGRLLEFNVFEGHGWPEVCEFLERPLPDLAFPWNNRRGAGD